MSKKNTEYIYPPTTDSDEEWKKFITQLFDAELETILYRVNSNPLLKDVKVPKKLEENLWKQINDYEKGKKSSGCS